MNIHEILHWFILPNREKRRTWYAIRLRSRETSLDMIDVLDPIYKKASEGLGRGFKLILP